RRYRPVLRDRGVPARAPLPADRDQDIRQRRVLDDNSAADRLLADQESDLGGRTNSRRLHGDLGDHGSRRAGWRVRQLPSKARPRDRRQALRAALDRSRRVRPAESLRSRFYKLRRLRLRLTTEARLVWERLCPLVRIVAASLVQTQPSTSRPSRGPRSPIERRETPGSSWSRWVWGSPRFRRSSCSPAIGRHSSSMTRTGSPDTSSTERSRCSAQSRSRVWRATVRSHVTMFISVSLKNECSLRLADPTVSQVSSTIPILA